ncbi:uncharacterized protein LOC111904743 [Lactuca sativa]|uniref:uncharacterized protein LOC111904743 n=1 Tax=Lactuca sativa TaxID=4236 RepID=UPI000CB9F5CB|nr:uncharacterized protein LOC111904743 [Lactuca sativa]
MAPATGFSYQRLRNEGSGDENYEYLKEVKRAIAHVKARIQWSSRLKRVPLRKKTKKMKIPSLRKFMRRKARVVMLSMAKVVKRLKDSQSHFGDLFAGNYLFMQVNPSSLKSSSPFAIRGSIKGNEDHDLRCSSSSSSSLRVS